MSGSPAVHRADESPASPWRGRSLTDESLFREPVGTLEVMAAGLQIAIRVLGAGPARERVAELIVTLDQF